MLIVVVAIFAILWLPHRGMLVYNTVAALNTLPRYMDLWFLMFAKTCIYINRYKHNQNHWKIKCSLFSAINPILYNALSTKFRRSFRRTLHCKSSSIDTLGCPAPSITYLATTRLSTVSVSRIDLGEYRRHSSKPYVERNGLLAVTPSRNLSVSISRSSSGSVGEIINDTNF